MERRKWLRKMGSIVLMIAGFTLSVCTMNVGDTPNGDGITAGDGIIDTDSNDDDGITNNGSGDTTKFEGTWKIEVEGGNVQAAYKFTGNTFEFSSNDTAETYFVQGPFSGTFEFTDTAIIFTLDDNSKTWSMEYALINGNLSLSNPQGDNPTKLENGTLTKEVVVLPSKFEGTWKTRIIAGASIRATYKFTGTIFEFSSNDTAETYIPQGPISGTFEFTDTKITFTTSGGSPKTWTMEYALKNENLILSLTQLQGSNPTIHFATLIKQGSSATSFESFEGTWRHQMLNAIYVFTGNQWGLTVGQNEYNVPTGSLSGTFTFDDASITFTATSGGSATWTQPYTIITQNNKEILDLEDNTSENMITWLYGSFEKQ
jgi:hypothetical protein